LPASKDRQLTEQLIFACRKRSLYLVAKVLRQGSSGGARSGVQLPSARDHGIGLGGGPPSRQHPMSAPPRTRPRSNASDRLALLRDNALFAELDQAAVERLASYMTRRRVRRGTTIFNKGDPGNGLMGVLSGMVKISVMSADGREAVLNIIQQGEVFGEIALLDGRPRTADATAMSDCEIMAIERRDFVPFLRSQPDIALRLIEILCARLRRTSEQVEDVMLLDLPSRLAKALLQLADKAAMPGSRQKVAITQREISQIIGISRESTNKQLRAWARRKWIRLERGGVAVLDPGALAQIAAKGLQDVS